MTENNTQETLDQTQIIETTSYSEVEETHASVEHHEGPHIPLIQGEQVWGPISNVTLTLIVFALLISGVSLLANRNLKK